MRVTARACAKSCIRTEITGSSVAILSPRQLYFILAGRGLIHVDDETAEVGPGDAIDIPAGSNQWIKNTGEADLVFLCLVDPAWRIEDEEVLKT